MKAKSVVALKKLNQYGFDHWIVGVLFAVIIGMSGTYYLISTHAVSWSGELQLGSDKSLCLNNNDGKATSANKVDIYTCNSNPDQKWTIDEISSNRFQLKDAAGTCLDDNDNGGSGAKVITWGCNSSAHAQVWEWEASKLQNAYQTVCVNDPYGAATSGTQLIMYGCTGTSNELWYEDSSGGGSNTSAGSGYYVSTTGSNNNNGTQAAPFATLAKCQSAMEVGSLKTCYIEAGTYKPTNDGSGCSDSSNALLLTSKDSGETWSYAPQNGYDTAVLDGQATSSNNGLNTGICVEAANVTVNGLQLENFQQTFIHVLGGANANVTNNIVHNSYDQPFVAAIKLDTLSEGSRVTHNVVYDVPSNGISSHSCNGGYGGCDQGISNDVIAYNVVYNYCEDDYDCGGVEFQDYDTPRSTNIVAEYNYVRDGDLVGPGAPANDTGGIGGGRAIYLDDGTSNVTIKGNIVTGKNDYCLQIHGGADDTYINNICDLQTPAANQNVGNNGESILYFQGSPKSNNMTGDIAERNIVIGSDKNGGQGYNGDGSATSKLTVSDSAYYNYAGGSSGSCDSDGIRICGTGGTDSSPHGVSGMFNTCPTNGANSWSFVLNPSSVVLTSSVDFTEPANDRGILWGRPGYWGPPGYAIPHTGNAPSYKPTC